MLVYGVDIVTLMKQIMCSFQNDVFFTYIITLSVCNNGPKYIYQLFILEILSCRYIRGTIVVYYH